MHLYMRGIVAIFRFHGMSSFLTPSTDLPNWFWHNEIVFQLQGNRDSKTKFSCKFRGVDRVEERARVFRPSHISIWYWIICTCPVVMQQHVMNILNSHLNQVTKLHLMSLTKSINSQIDSCSRNQRKYCLHLHSISIPAMCSTRTFTPNSILSLYYFVICSSGK